MNGLEQWLALIPSTANLSNAKAFFVLENKYVCAGSVVISFPS